MSNLVEPVTRYFQRVVSGARREPRRPSRWRARTHRGSEAWQTRAVMPFISKRRCTRRPEQYGPWLKGRYRATRGRSYGDRCFTVFQTRQKDGRVDACSGSRSERPEGEVLALQTPLQADNSDVVMSRSGPAVFQHSGIMTGGGASRRNGAAMVVADDMTPERTRPAARPVRKRATARSACLYCPYPLDWRGPARYSCARYRPWGIALRLPARNGLSACFRVRCSTRCYGNGAIWTASISCSSNCTRIRVRQHRASIT